MKNDHLKELQAAYNLHQKGKLSEAANLYRQLIKKDPNDFHTLHFLGVIEAAAGNIEKAKTLMARSMPIQPPNIQFIENYAAILFQAEDYKSAVDVCRQGLQLNNANVALLYLSAISLLKLFKLQESLTQFDKIISLQPNHIIALNERGSVLAQMKQYDAALASMERALIYNSKYAEAHLNKGNLFAELDRNEEALGAFDKALTLKPDLAEAWLGRGNVFRRLKRDDDALTAYDRALAVKPNFAEAYVSRGDLWANKGDFKKSTESYSLALQIKPNYAEGYHAYSIATKIKQDDPFVPKMKKLLDAEDLSEKKLMHLHFALAKVEHDLGNKEAYINHLTQGNAIKKKSLSYDFSQDEQLFYSIREFFESDRASSQDDFSSNISATPIFILGMPRSGTTLVEQIVSSHSKVFGAGELAFLDQAIISSKWRLEKDRQQVFSTVRNLYNQKITGVSDASIITDKMPFNFRWIGFIKNALPNAKIVHVKREPAAVCWSNLKTYFLSEIMAFTFDARDIAKYYKRYEGLMEFWHQKYPKTIYDLSYEKLTENQEEETRKLFDYLELGWEDNVLEFHMNERSVSTASNFQVRQKMYKGSSLEWKAYEQWLQPMLEILDA
jgi:tetratricopeptide (TPR) repeat protein